MATLPRPESDDLQSWGFRLVDDLAKLSGLLQVKGNGLVADDIYASLQKGLCYLEMKVVLNHDGNEINALVFRKLAFFFRHLLI